MAIITFKIDLDSTKLTPAYNNAIVSFSAIPQNSIYCIITIFGKEYKIYPDSNGVFWYDFRFLFSKLINDDKWSDKVAPSLTEEVYLDDDLFLEIPIKYEIFSDPTTSDIVNKTVDVIKSVIDYKSELLNNELTKITPFDKVSVFKGYPFDVSFWADVTAPDYTVTKVAEVTGVAATKGVNRLFLEIASGPTQLLPTVGVKHGGDTIEWDVKEYDCEGIYLKWYVREGGWAYWLFNQKHKETIRGKSVGELYNDFENVTDIISPKVSMGKERGVRVKLHATGIEQFEIDIISTIITSPKVLLYEPESQQWLEVECMTTTMVVNNYELLKFNTSIDIDIPQTQMLL